MSLLLKYKCQQIRCWFLKDTLKTFKFEIPKIGIRGNKNYAKRRWVALLTNPHFVCNIYKTICLQNRIKVGGLMLAMCSKPRGYERNFDWLS